MLPNDKNKFQMQYLTAKNEILQCLSLAESDAVHYHSVAVVCNKSYRSVAEPVTNHIVQSENHCTEASCSFTEIDRIDLHKS